MDVGFIMEVERLAAALDGLDYFEVLRLPHEAAAADVKAAYYRESRAYTRIGTRRCRRPSCASSSPASTGASTRPTRCCATTPGGGATSPT